MPGHHHRWYFPFQAPYFAQFYRVIVSIGEAPVDLITRPVPGPPLIWPPTWQD